MSHRIEYQWGAFLVPAAKTGLATERFVVAIEGGDNNVCHPRTGKRTRAWDVGMIGTADQVLRQAVYYAGACEGGSLQPGGRWCKPEAYIRRIRRLIEGPEYLCFGAWRAVLRVAPDHAVVADVQKLGFAPTLENWYGQQRLVLPFSPEHYPVFFGLIDQYCDELPAWCFAEVHGLRAS